ncbi:hypothetical protein C3H73_06430 [Campylobacter jejuni]|uniref:formyltransferase family protein n=1 Tax=Campylobacter jejuni TaxID=197 RepID=UPI000F806F60|nr:formyltransferase family protein [Campylobacter jejuni]RTJ41757.1 hypothetical protein C3H73_06430 [Campylobacter jejuni]
MKKIIILTSDGIRHTFLRKAIASNANIQVLKSYCEKHSDQIYNYAKNSLQIKHLIAREISEKDFFGNFIDLVNDNSNPIFIEKDEINNIDRINEIIKLNPDLIIAYGCSIIKEPLLEYFQRKIINVHLGLSPYYRGSGTNYFPFVNNELQFIGATFMYMDKGIDTGEIIHQIQAQIYHNDSIHQIGNRLIGNIVKIYIDIINNFEKLKKIRQPKDKKCGKLYKKIDFTLQTLIQIDNNFKNGMIENYLKNKTKIKLYQNPYLNSIKQFI